MYAPLRRFYNALRLVEVSHTDVTCFDGSDGSITVSATGGKAPYQYSMDENFSTYNTDGVFSGLSITGPVVEGEDEYGGTVECTKTVYVRDAKSNVTSLEVTLKSPVYVDWKTFPEDITVYNDEGENYATVIFDMPTLTSTANGGYIEMPTLPTDNHYSIGTNALTFKPHSSCRGLLWPNRQLHITVLEGTPLTLTEDTTAHQNVTCFDGSNGSVTVVASGGESPYIYSQDPSFETYNSTGVFDNLSITGPITEGTDEYGGIITCTKTFYVKDANNVISSVNVELSSPVELQWLNVPEDIVVYCDDGQNYATIVRGVDIIEPTLSTTANIPSPLYNRMVTVSGYQPNGQYEVGTYSIQYSALNTCQQGDTYTFTINVLPPPLTLTEDLSAHQDISCFRNADGSITVEASGGTAPYVYSIDDFATEQTSGTFSSLDVPANATETTDETGGIYLGYYTVKVKDANDNVASLEVEMIKPVKVAWDIFPENITTYADQGEDYATVTFNMPTLTSYWGGEYIEHGEIPANNHYPIGTTSITFAAKGGCKPATMPSRTLTITVLPRVTLTEVTADHHDVTCFDGGDGSITVSAQGDYGPFIYSMDENFSTYNSTGVFDNLAITGPVTESTDEYGGILVCTKRIYVKDSQNNTNYLDVELKSPVELEWLNVPQDMTVYCDAGENYATVIVGNGNDVDIEEPVLSTTANITNPRWITNNKSSQNRYYYSSSPHTITFSARNSCSNDVKICTFTITVLPNNE